LWFRCFRHDTILILSQRERREELEREKKKRVADTAEKTREAKELMEMLGVRCHPLSPNRMPF